jgi:hypothetical protein
MAILSKDQIKTNVQSELADNNAGLISAYDVRHNMEDIVDSINQIVASGDFESTNPFVNNVKFLRNIIAQSGIQFSDTTIQYTAYPGPGSVQHNSLAGLTTGDVHTQYLPLGGVRVMTNNLGLGSNWINSSGNSQVSSSNNRGIRFQYASSTQENVIIGNKSTVVFETDSSKMNTAKGVAKAWISFDASGVSHVPEVRDSYNITQLEKIEVGKFRIVFTSGTLKNNDYVAIGTSNSRTTAASKEDFDLNTVGIVARSGDDASVLRSLTFCILNDAGNYVDAQINDLVVYGLGVGESSGVPPTVVVL